MLEIRPNALALFAASLALSFAPTNVVANAFHSVSAIERAVISFSGRQPGESGGLRAAIDRKLRLAQCQSPLELEWYGSHRQAVRVSCPGQPSWRIYVPMVETRAAVAAPAILRKDALRVEAGGTGFRVVRSGEALEDGRIGELIRVRLDDGSRRGRVISARVLEAGRVQVGMY